VWNRDGSRPNLKLEQILFLINKDQNQKKKIHKPVLGLEDWIGGFIKKFKSFRIETDDFFLIKDWMRMVCLNVGLISTSEHTNLY
jgi:hypothetical protein